MKIERNFNKRAAQLVDVQRPIVHHGKGDALGIAVMMAPSHEQTGRSDIGYLRMHLTPAEAIEFGLSLIHAGRDRLNAIGKLD